MQNDLYIFFIVIFCSLNYLEFNVIYNLANKVPSSIEIKHNTAKSHNNFDAMSTQNDATQIFSTNHTSSFSYATNIWGSSIHDNSYNLKCIENEIHCVEIYWIAG